jgi:hypothetical protein
MQIPRSNQNHENIKFKALAHLFANMEPMPRITKMDEIPAQKTKDPRKRKVRSMSVGGKNFPIEVIFEPTHRRTNPNRISKEPNIIKPDFGVMNLGALRDFRMIFVL